MKLTSSPSISGFLSFLLRRILCSTNLPTHPFDHLREIDKFEHQSMNPPPHNPDDDLATPGLVARLMGLDSMPDTIHHKNSPSITRSKSMNSVDFRAEDLDEQGHHRRMKTCVSFRETPSYFEVEDDDFFIISFDNGGQNRKPSSKKAKAEMGVRENEQRRRRRSKGMSKERPRFKFEEDNSSEALVLEIDNSDETKARNRRKKKDKCLDGAKIETESESENSSPVSVLDHTLFISSDHQVLPIPVEKESGKRNSRRRRRLTSKLSNASSDPSNESCPKGKDEKPSEASKGKRVGLARKGGHRNGNRQLWRLAKAEMLELELKCKGGLMRNLKNWESQIGMELGLQIVDQLLNEVVDQLLLLDHQI